ncbi:MAG: ubiquinol-cytochrome C chaperone family protein [Candidatus Puniceispirillaceae bacterium]
MFSRLRNFFAFAERSEAAMNAPAETLYQLCLTHSRDPQLFLTGGVEDTLDGRFDSLCLSVGCVMHRLALVSDTHQQQAKQTSQQLFDIFCSDMDLTLREMGVGDLGVSKRVKTMSEAFIGRLTAYREALTQNDKTALEDALLRNLYRSQTPSDTQKKQAQILATQVLTCIGRLSKLEDGDVLSASIELPPIAR